ncbi:Rqc2 family fibronectin-binding protein [Peribacillus alkalitolerans]|uniref:Rqc2 family fibronectin-binding protein n=1 Tax=Peribacillus alkalitolerans TaxID=1550385 RepID=UPI0013D021B9|nr:NFACT RNA binding domain-containing protein [Peribacillus alkalitolerans]
MSFDGLFTRAMVEELSTNLKGGRISKINQPFKNELLMIVRANGKNHKLLISAHPSYARIQLTDETPDNPKEPPMFCMLLRKHLEGYIIEDIVQKELDRIIIFEIKGRNEIGDISYKQLIVEIMGRHSNIILIDKERGMILDSIKHVSYAVNSYRAILPGQDYKYPPEQDKQNPLTVEEEDILRKIDFNSGKLDKQLVQQFAGVSPMLAKEIISRSGLANRETVPKTFMNIMEEVKVSAYVPSIMEHDRKESFYFLSLNQFNGSKMTYPTLSEMLDRYYFGKADRDRIKQQAQDLERFILNEKEKNEKKIGKLEKTLEESKNADQLQLYGELITANMYQLQKGMKEVTVVNYYEEDETYVMIPLDPLKGPSDNAQKYFTRYQKSKNSIDIVKEQIRIAEEEVSYFDALLQQLDSASPRDIEEIREELTEGGYIKQRQRKGPKKNTNTKPQLEKYISSTGDEILVGKNNKQNEYLTNKLANRDEIWFHTKDIPGSHVVIRNESPSHETIREAAILAAYFSKAKESSSVPVDYTKIRHVKKPNGSKPGFVIYDNQQTVYVTPNPDVVRALKK